MNRIYTDGRSEYRALTTTLTKRFSQKWQGTATYTLSGAWDAEGVPDVGFDIAKDLGGDYTLAANDQRHRAVFNGIWQLPAGLQLSGLYFYGSGLRYFTQYGADLRDRGATNPADGGAQPGRLRPDGTIMPRNNFVGRPLHRVDVRVLKRFVVGRANIDGMFEIFNLFNHANYGSYVTVESNARYGEPQQNTTVSVPAPCGSGRLPRNFLKVGRSAK